MIVEAQLDRANGVGRRAVTECLQRSYDGTTIMASMGSLAHYMQELSSAGFNLDDFLHEGSGPIWQQAYCYEPSRICGMGDDRGSRRGRRHAVPGSSRRGRDFSPPTSASVKAETSHFTAGNRGKGSDPFPK